jgi:glucose-fructose oxidoreductase
MRRWKIAGINFDHFHMGDNLRMAVEHPQVELVGICDERPEQMASAIRALRIPAEIVYTDYQACLERTQPDLVLLCPAAARHAEWTAKVAPYGVHILMEKPLASSLSEADAMIAAMAGTGKQLAINWPLTWYPAHRTAKRLIDNGTIGQLLEVHFYDGNRGPLWHTAGKSARTAEQVEQEKPSSWFYQRAYGGGSLLDYLGYGTTLGTWFLDGRRPLDVTSMVHIPRGLEVDEHSITIARYASGLSKFETRWGTFSDPWTTQPQPKCGFVLVGDQGTLSSYDYEPAVMLQTPDRAEAYPVPVDRLRPPCENPVQYMIDCLERDVPVDGPLSVPISRIGQQIVDTALRSAEEGRTLKLLG